MKTQNNTNLNKILSLYRIVLVLTAFTCLHITFLSPVQAAEYQSVPVYADKAEKLPAFFEQCKQNEPMLIAFLRQMPKGADLHNHASGAFSAQTYIDEAIDKNYYFDRDTKGFVTSKPANGFPARAMITDFSLLGEAMSALTMGNAANTSGESGHDHFFLAFRRFPKLSDETKNRAFMDLFLRNISQNVTYMEIMSTPPPSTKEKMNFAKQAPSKAEEQSELENLKKAWRMAEDQFKKAAGEGSGNALKAESTVNDEPKISRLKVNYITSVSRDKFPEYDASGAFNADAYRKYFSEQVTQCFEDMKVGKYVSMTILSPEDSWLGRTQFDVQMSVIDEVWRKYQQGGFTANMNLHGGELTTEYSPFKDMDTRISDTIDLGHTRRIGHGVSIAWNKDLWNLLEKMKKEKIAVEICLTSNAGILNVNEGRKHPFMLYWKAGVPVVICTDDEGISTSNITLEYARAAQWFDLSYGQIKWLSLWSLEHSFLPGDSLFENGDMSRPKANPPKNSEKAAMQQKLYQKFKTFEENMIKSMNELNL